MAFWFFTARLRFRFWLSSDAAQTAALLLLMTFFAFFGFWGICGKLPVSSLVARFHAAPSLWLFFAHNAGDAILCGFCVLCVGFAVVPLFRSFRIVRLRLLAERASPSKSDLEALIQTLRGEAFSRQEAIELMKSIDIARGSTKSERLASPAAPQPITQRQPRRL